MLENSSSPVLLCGRYFTTRELLEIQEIVRLFPRLSRAELANTICENLDWVTPAGKNKKASCLQLLGKLESQGQITLPAKQGYVSGNKKEINFGPHTAPDPLLTGYAKDQEPLSLEPVRRSFDFKLWNEYIHRYHSLRYKHPFGASQRYFIISGSGQKLGCLLFAAAAWALAPRDEWIGWTKADKSLRLNLVLNNSRFLIFPWVRVKNLASKVLSLATKRIQSDWQKRYGYRPVLLETFVDPEKYEGTSYQAANWIYLGRTKGRGRMDRYTKKPFTQKDIYVYPLGRDFRALLGGKGGDIR